MAGNINIKFPMRKSSKGAFDMNQSTIRAVADDLRILIISNYGERPIHYDFGANLRKILFEQSPNIKQQIIDSITSAVDKWMSFVTLQNIEVDDNATNGTLRLNEIKVKITFLVGQLEGVLEQVVRA